METDALSCAVSSFSRNSNDLKALEASLNALSVSEFKSDPRFVGLWLSRAALVEKYRGEEDARQVYKTMRTERIGSEDPVFYTAWIRFEEKHDNPEKALQIVNRAQEKGIKLDLDAGMKIRSATDPERTEVVIMPKSATKPLNGLQAKHGSTTEEDTVLIPRSVTLQPPAQFQKVQSKGSAPAAAKDGLTEQLAISLGQGKLGASLLAKRFVPKRLGILGPAKTKKETEENDDEDEDEGLTTPAKPSLATRPLATPSYHTATVSTSLATAPTVTMENAAHLHSEHWEESRENDVRRHADRNGDEVRNRNRNGRGDGDGDATMEDKENQPTPQRHVKFSRALSVHLSSNMAPTPMVSKGTVADVKTPKRRVPLQSLDVLRDALPTTTPSTTGGPTQTHHHSPAAAPQSGQNPMQAISHVPHSTFHRPALAPIAQPTQPFVDRENVMDPSPRKNVPLAPVAPATHRALAFAQNALPVQAPVAQHNLQASGQVMFGTNEQIVVHGVTYIRLECVGKGGSCKVFKVLNPIDRKIYALKRVKLTNLDPHSVESFRNEVMLLLKLRGKDNIVQLVDHEVVDNAILYMVLEFGETDLAQLLQKQGSRTENFRRLYWQAMLESVQTVHNERIVHADLKPSNFLIVSGQLKLIDFGIAETISAGTTNVHRENQVGTINYMSPESISKSKQGRPSDVWSLGCILYQMTYGRPPFAHLSTMVQRIQAITDDKHPISFPEEADGQKLHPLHLDILRKCLQRDPDMRPTIPELLQHPFTRGELAMFEQVSAHVLTDYSVIAKQMVRIAGISASTDKGRFFMERIAAVLQNGEEVDMDALHDEWFRRSSSLSSSLSSSHTPSRLSGSDRIPIVAGSRC
eukprot:ANDGO_01714.mRNA.1 Serine/threonine-protein kinase mph1